MHTWCSYEIAGRLGRERVKITELLLSKKLLCVSAVRQAKTGTQAYTPKNISTMFPFHKAKQNVASVANYRRKDLPKTTSAEVTVTTASGAVHAYDAKKII